MKQSKNGKSLGVFSKENYPGAFMDAWRATLKNESFDTVSKHKSQKDLSTRVHVLVHVQVEKVFLYICIIHID